MRLHAVVFAEHLRQGNQAACTHELDSVERCHVARGIGMGAQCAAEVLTGPAGWLSFVVRLRRG